MSQTLKFRLVTPPAVEPVSVNEAKQHLRLEDEDGDDAALLAGLIRSVREFAERFLGRALITQTYLATLDAWPTNHRVEGQWWDGTRDGAVSELSRADRAIELPRPPLQSIELIRTFDDVDQATTFASSNYLVDAISQPGRVVLRNGVAPPVALRAANAIEIQFKAGYGDDPQSVPEAIRLGMLQVIAHLYENRGDETDQAARETPAVTLWQPYRILRI